MQKYIRHQLRRSVVSNILFCLLLTLAGTLLCISAGLWFSAHRAILDIDETVTTIAVPNPLAIRRHAEAIGRSEDEVYQMLRTAVYDSGLVELDSRRLYNAIADDILPVPLQVTGFGIEPHIVAHSSQFLAAFVVTCAVVEADYIPTLEDIGEGGAFFGQWDSVRKQYAARFTVDEALHLHHNVDKPLHISIFFNKTQDGISPFEVGNQYIVMGQLAGGGGFQGTQHMGIDMPDVEVTRLIPGAVYDWDELVELLGPHLWWGVEPDLPFPLEIFEYAFEHEPDDGWPGIIELHDSLDDALASPRWHQISEPFDIIDISARSFQVLTTNDANSLFRINQDRNIIYDGRLINAREHARGERVALVGRDFALHNGLSVGDTISLEFYAATIGTRSVIFRFGEFGRYRIANVWVPSEYQYGLEITEPIEYTIVGITNAHLLDVHDHALTKNMIIIPDNSFEGVAGEPMIDQRYVSTEFGFDTLRVATHVPLLTDGIIIPNGYIDETIALINSLDSEFGGLFNFYDQGYGTLMAALGNLRFGMSWILGLVSAVWITVIFMFSMFFTARKRKEAAVLCAIGVSKNDRFCWVFTQSSMLIILSLVLSLAISLPLFNYIVDVAGNLAQTFTDEFRVLTLSDAAESGLRARIPLDASPIFLLIISLAGSALLLIVTTIMSARSVVFNSLSAGKGEG